MINKISPKGIELIKRFEGCRLKAYKCPAGVWTIGFGATGPGIKEGLVWTQKQADDRLADDLREFEDLVSRYAHAIQTQGQFDALVSFTYNLGGTSLRQSTLLRMHNEGDYAGAAGQFGRWNKAGGKVLGGLIKRRAAEAELYSS